MIKESYFSTLSATVMPDRQRRGGEKVSQGEKETRPSGSCQRTTADLRVAWATDWALSPKGKGLGTYELARCLPAYLP